MTASLACRLLRLSAVGLVAVVPVVGCGSGQPGGSGAGERPASSAPPSGDAGISAREARERGVFSAELDARLDPPSGTVEGAVGANAEFRLVNMGAGADVYEITVDPPSAGSVEPATVELEPAGSTVLEVTLTSTDEHSVLRVVSAGRRAEIAAFVLSGR